MIIPDWPAPPGVRSAFTVRTGGFSVAPYESLNVGAHVGDAPDAVRNNRRRVREVLCLPGEPVWLQQVHGFGVVDVGGATVPAAVPIAEGVATAVRPTARDRTAGDARDVASGSVNAVESATVADPPRADSAVSHAAGRVCVIQVADCMPVLFAARDGSAVGAAHAGWRGLAGGVLEATVAKLGVAPSDLLAWLGPTISQKNFEVGEDVRIAFTSADPGAVTAFVANTRGRWQCDLYALARRRLAALGVASVFGGGWCTYADSARFFSFRRDGQCGRMAALIWLE